MSDAAQTTTLRKTNNPLIQIEQSFKSSILSIFVSSLPGQTRWVYHNPTCRIQQSDPQNQNRVYLQYPQNCSINQHPTSEPMSPKSFRYQGCTKCPKPNSSGDFLIIRHLYTLSLQKRRSSTPKVVDNLGSSISFAQGYSLGSPIPLPPENE